MIFIVKIKSNLSYKEENKQGLESLPSLCTIVRKGVPREVILEKKYK
jgi:hypothetical protein